MMPAVPARVDLVTPAVRAAAAGVVGAVAALLLPLPAAAAPAPCEQAQRYAAQSGTKLIRIGNLNRGPAGRESHNGHESRNDRDSHDSHGSRDDRDSHDSRESRDDRDSRDRRPIKDVGVGDAKSALVAQSAINAAALGRMLDRGPAGRKALTEVFQQTAPPTHQQPSRREHDATEVGPFRLGPGKLTVHARWEPGMACGNAEGEATRAQTELRRAGVLDDGDATLVRVPEKISGLSTTALQRRGPDARTVAAASLAGSRIELLDGAVLIEIVRPPSLLARMSGTAGGEVRYRPATLKVSGAGLKTARLDTAGDNVEFRLDEDAPDRVAAEGEDAPETDLPEVGTLAPAEPLPLPSLPGIPPLDGEPGTEAAPAAGPGTTVRVALGDVRQAVAGHAIAAKATAITIAITKGPNPQRYGHSTPNRSGVALHLDVGLLEVAAVAPEPEGGASSTVASEGAGRDGAAEDRGGLPITGPRLDVLALAGVALLIAGTAALIFGLRGRSRP